MRRGTYAKNLIKQIKLRLDEVTFNNITEISEEAKKNTLLSFTRHYNYWPEKVI
jgi:hypothetical protein